MKFPRLIFLDRFIPNASSLPSESRDSMGFQRRPFPEVCLRTRPVERHGGKGTFSSLLARPTKTSAPQSASNTQKIPSSP